MAPHIGIDFGTTTSSMAWYNPKAGQAEVLLNAEGEPRTPSVVYVGAAGPLVGTPAAHMLEDEEERKRVVLSVKRNLVQTPLLWLGGKPVKAIEVAAAILAKLKRDAESLHFHEPVRRAVITCPASFNVLQRDKIAEAGTLAGFEAIELLEEPIAAALAYAHAGLKVGNRLLVYDLGGGTFDVAVLIRENGSWRLGIPPRGLDHCGGDDFDRALYDHCEQRAFNETGGTISQDGLVNLHVLQLCRARKETLSSQERSTFSAMVQRDGKVMPFKLTIDRSTFEDLIAERVQMTARLTHETVAEAQAAGMEIETVVLVGGSSKVPLVRRLLEETLPVAPQRWHQQDVAVALGAAYRAQALWEAVDKQRDASATLTSPLESDAAQTRPEDLSDENEGRYTGDYDTFNAWKRRELFREAQIHYEVGAWDKSIELLRQLDKNSGIPDAAPLLREAERQRDLSRRYERGRAAMVAAAWDEAITHLQAVLDIDPAYRDAEALLTEAREKRQTARSAGRRSWKWPALAGSAVLALGVTGLGIRVCCPAPSPTSVPTPVPTASHATGFTFSSSSPTPGPTTASGGLFHWQSVATPTPTAASRFFKPVTLVQQSGQGSYTTDKFLVIAMPMTVRYAWTCPSAGSRVYVNILLPKSDATFEDPLTAILRKDYILANKILQSRGTFAYNHPGWYELYVNATSAQCSWHVEVTAG